MLIEFLPGSKQWLLTLLSLFWCLGQVFAAVVGWGFITNYRCSEASNCPTSSNMGWRYTWFLCGGVTLILFLLRFVIYPIPESPKFLIANGRDEEALEVLLFIAKENGKTCNLTLQQLQDAGKGHQSMRSLGETIKEGGDEKIFAGLGDEEKKDPYSNIKPVVLEVDEQAKRAVRSGNHLLSRDTWAQLKKSSENLDGKHVKALFCSKKMALNTSLVMLCWSLIGLAYPLFNAFVSIYIAESGGNTGSNVSQAEQYRQLVIIAVCGIPGSLLATAAVELPYAGRRGSMAFFTLLTGCFLFGFTTARSPSAVLGWNCGVSLAQNAMYGILCEFFFLTNSYKDSNSHSTPLFSQLLLRRHYL